MVAAVLVKAAAGCKLRHGSAHELGIPQQRIPAVTRAQDAVEFDAHALAGNLIEQRRTGRQRCSRCRLDREIQPAREPYRAQHAQGIFLEAPARLAHRANLPVR